MVERAVIGDRPVAVEYRIAPVGHSLQPLIDALLLWTTTHLPIVEQARERFDDLFDGAPSAQGQGADRAGDPR
jgi:DNA-binding HxlR family transcriptional regulator